MMKDVTPEFFTAAFAGVTLLIYFTMVIVSAAAAIFRKIDKVKETILADVNMKHHENDQRYQVLNSLVIRHDLLLEQGFGNHRGKTV